MLRFAAAGDPEALGRLLDLVYGELHGLAAHYLGQERSNHTLQPTALVNEAFLRLIDQRVEWQNRGHFLGVAAQAMRRILIDHARGANRLRRGGAWNRVQVDGQLLEPGSEAGDESLELVALDAALTKLAGVSERMARIVELRFFAGLEVEAVAEVLEVSPRTVRREWRYARAWLGEELRRDDA